MRQIEAHMSDEACNIHHSLSNLNDGQLDDGIYKEFSIGEYRFGCALQKLSEKLKVTFYFYDCLTKDEHEYWQHKDYQFRLKDYQFRMNDCSNPTDYNHTLAVMRLRNIHKDLPVKVIMFKCLDTLLKFKRDFKYVGIMLRTRPYEAMVQKWVDKKCARHVQ